MLYDLLIKADRVLDPGQRLNGPLDIGISGGRITALQPEIPSSEAKKTIEVRGANRYVVPGLIDPHLHVGWGATTLGVGMECVDPDLGGVRAGVTTVADAGSVGVANVGVFPTHLLPRAKTRVICFVNAGSYAHTMPGLPDITRLEDVDRDAIAACIEANPGLVSGVKLRLVGPIMLERGEEVVRLTKEIVREHRLPLMVHIGDPQSSSDRLQPLTRFLLESLEPGDILTHLCTPNVGGVMRDGKPVPELRDAKERGVFFDPAMGGTHFDFEIAMRQAESGIRPDTISTDLTAIGRARGVFSLTESMAKFMAVGYSLEDVISMTTYNAARVIGLQDEAGAIATGREADLTILDVVPGPWKLADARGNVRPSQHAFVPVQTLRAGALYAPDWGPHPWGWLPEPA